MVQELVHGLLGNGLRVVIAPRMETSVAATWVFTRGGSDYESRNNSGVHHFLEHMYFKGTKRRRDPRDIWRSIEGRGGAINAETDRETVGYGSVMGRENLDLILELLADILLNSRFEQKDIELEKGVILEEKKGCNDIPQGEIHGLWDKWLYPGSPWGFPIEGSTDGIKSMDRDKLIACMREHYVSNSIVLSVAGRVEPDTVMKLVNKYFSKVKRGNIPTKPLGISYVQSSPRLFLQPRPTEQTHLMLGVRGYDLFNPQKCAFELLGIILGGNCSSRLFTSVREERGLAYDIHTDNSIYTDRGDLATYSGVDHADLSEVVRIILDEYKSIAENGVTQQELDVAKEYIIGAMSRDMEHSGTLAAFLALKELFSDQNPTPQQEMEAVRRVTLGDIRMVARDIFTNEKLNLVVLGPHRNRTQLKKLLKF